MGSVSPYLPTSIPIELSPFNCRNQMELQGGLHLPTVLLERKAVQGLPCPNATQRGPWEKGKELKRELSDCKYNSP